MLYSAAMGLTQAQHLQELAADVDTLKSEARRIAAGLTEAQLSWTPLEGKWGVGLCLEHLIATDQSYFAGMRRTLTKAREKATRAPTYGWKPTLAGRFLLNAVRPGSRSVRNPRVFAPPHAPRDRVLDTFLAVQDELVALMREADGVDLNRAKLSSPASPLLRLNLGDAFTILVLHTQRHLQQAQRVLEESGFPR